MSPIDVSDRKALAVQDTRRTAVRFAATIGRGTKFLVPPDPAHLLVQKSRPETFQKNVFIARVVGYDQPILYERPSEVAPQAPGNPTRCPCIG